MFEELPTLGRHIPKVDDIWGFIHSLTFVSLWGPGPDSLQLKTDHTCGARSAEHGQLVISRMTSEPLPPAEAQGGRGALQGKGGHYGERKPFIAVCYEITDFCYGNYGAFV